MSRLGKKPINILPETSVVLNDGVLTVKGPKGELSRKFKDNIEIKVEGNSVILNPRQEDNFSKILWGTYASHISNMIEGVNKEFEKKLVVEGVGYRMELKGEKLVLNMGFSHPVEVEVPKGIKVAVEKDSMTISGIDKDLVGQFAAQIRAIKKPEPYKGKGIRYSDEVIRRKQGKKSI